MKCSKCNQLMFDSNAYFKMNKIRQPYIEELELLKEQLQSIPKSNKEERRVVNDNIKLVNDKVKLLNQCINSLY